MTAMKTAEAWARRMKKVTDRTRAKICLSILPPPPPPFTFPRLLPLPLPPPSVLSRPRYPFRLLPVRIPSYFSSSRFSLFSIFARLPPLPSHSPSSPKLFTSRRGDGGEKPVGRFSNDASKKRDHGASDRFRSSTGYFRLVRGDEREKKKTQRFQRVKEEIDRGNNDARSRVFPLSLRKERSNDRWKNGSTSETRSLKRRLAIASTSVKSLPDCVA